GPHLPKELGPLMKACLSLEPPHRPLAKTIHDIISDVSRDTASGEGGNGNGDAVSYHQTAATPREDARLARAPYREAGQEASPSGSTARAGSAAAAIPAPQAPTPAHAANEDAVKGGAPPRPMRLPREVARGGVTKGGVTKGGVTKDSAAKSSAAKDLPPPAPVVAAQSGLPHKLAAKRRPLLLAALGLTVILFAYLSLRQAPPNPPPQPASYLVNISVTPDGLRGVRLTVVSSPPGSQHQPGSQFTNLPGWVVFDREGLWVLRASFNSRAAEVSIRVPQERYVTVDFPD
ncbi:MAG: hypothetical protein M3511_01515, partial [Deinococcota bacterium]|nr:hypothetical protein [Deinococcota bacterium]